MTRHGGAVIQEPAEALLVSRSLDLRHIVCTVLSQSAGAKQPMVLGMASAVLVLCKGLGLLIVESEECCDGSFRFAHAGVRTELDLTLR
jgi:hypothetical protein